MLRVASISLALDADIVKGHRNETGIEIKTQFTQRILAASPLGE